MKTKITLICILLISLIILLSACNSGTQVKTAEFFALDTVIDITAYGDAADEAIASARSEIRRLEKLLSATSSDSDIGRLNSLGSTEVSDEVSALIVKAVDISRMTGGRFDPTLYRVQRLWGFTSGDYRVPTDSEIKSELTNTGCNNVLIENNAVTLNGSAELDLGGIAKGYIADKAAEAMLEAGCEYGLISLGGNIRAVGHKPSDEPFKIGIKHPDNDGYFAVLSITEGSVITSGAYQRNFTENGKSYHHILDPKTGYPSESDAASVTVIGTDGALCDALSTAIFVGGSDFAAELYGELSSSFEYLILTEGSQVYASEGLRSRLEIAEEYGELQILFK